MLQRILGSFLKVKNISKGDKCYSGVSAMFNVIAGVAQSFQEIPRGYRDVPLVLRCFLVITGGLMVRHYSVLGKFFGLSEAFRGGIQGRSRRYQWRYSRFRSVP